MCVHGKGFGNNDDSQRRKERRRKKVKCLFVNANIAFFQLLYCMNDAFYI
jgi:hypothetical protein